VVLKAQDTLSFVDLTRASGAAKISTAGLMDIQVLGAGEDCVWFAAWVEKQKAQCLFRWDPSQTKTENDRTYLEPYYTADNPNLDGLQACKELARTLGDQYGVNILIWNDTDAYHPWDYTFIPEHRPEIYRRDLQALEQALQKFPEGFLNEAASGSDNGRLTICLVRGLKREEQTNAPENADGAQYWMEDSPYIALAVGESLEQTFYHQISHLIDSCVISTSKAYDDWEYLNPWEFNYDYDYEENKNREDEGYLDDENRLFIDTYSMSYPREDRARILEYAMMPGNESYFASEQMQEKLSVICSALREVFDLDPDQQYAWEQYLKDSE
jgi:hypothetical protein